MNGHFLVMLFFLMKTADATVFTTQCPQYCTCDFTKNILTLTCSQYSSSFSLPSAPSVPDLSSTLSIIAKFNYLLSLPANLCQFQSSLRILDLSSNLINSSITASSFNCLLNLEFLNVSINSLNTIDPNAFILMSSLLVLDLSYNKITFLPATLFTGNKLQKLKYLYLNNNLLKDIDVWFFYLKSIIKIDLSNNQITQFRNRINWSPTTITSTQLSNATIVDLRYNYLARFDDSILTSYGLCTAQDLSYFFYLMNVVRIDQNPLNCSCSSYNMLMFYQTLLSSQSIALSSNLFKATCLYPSQYIGLSIFNFTSPDSCSSISTPLANSCQITTTPATLSTESIQNPNNPELLLGSQPFQPVSPYLNDGQIAGVVIGFVGAVLLLIILLYCLCPTEILACLFGIFPAFYRVCPCKSGVISHKYYDVFISYNKSSENWIREKLLPFMRSKRSNDKYFLQYDPSNVNQEKFGSFTRGKMDNSAVILIILTDKYLMKEWQVTEFRNHLRHLLTKVPNDNKDRTRLICIQMNDVSDEEVDDYVRHKLQIPRFISLENDEFYFWHKLNYFLHTNKESDPVIVPGNYFFDFFEYLVLLEIFFLLMKNLGIKAP